MIPGFLDLARCWIHERHLARRYSASAIYICWKLTNTISASHEYALAWYPKGVSASLAPKLLITSDMRIVACWNTWIAWIHNRTGVVIVVSLSYICLRQRVYIPSSKTQSEASHFFPHIIETKLQLALPSYFLASTSTKAISQDGVSLCRSRYVLSLRGKNSPPSSFTTRTAKCLEIFSLSLSLSLSLYISEETQS